MSVVIFFACLGLEQKYLFMDGHKIINYGYINFPIFIWKKDMAKDCCWNCKYYIVKGDNERNILSGALSNVCTFSDKENDASTWTERANPTPTNYICRFHKERVY